MTSAYAEARPGTGTDWQEALLAIEQRVLWLSAAIVHHANRVRSDPSGLKVGGHQASSASMVTIMTELWFRHLRQADRVSVKPHASPVLHAINYLLGELDGRYLTTLRDFGGLQSYPSRVKDPDPVDYSTGSVGIGATAPIWGALARRYAGSVSGKAGTGRQYSLVGDAELDEGACWEAIIDPMAGELGEVVWIIDVNRQSLDRIVPILGVPRLEGMFSAAAIEDGRPTVIFAYTIKGYGLATEGHPQNHSALLSDSQFAALARQLGTDPQDPWAPFPAGSAAAALCADTALRLRREPVAMQDPPVIPADFGRTPAHRWTGSPTIPRHSCTGASVPRASTSNSGSPRPTWSACSASSAPPGPAGASRCCRSAFFTTRSSSARSSRGRSASTRAASPSSWAPHPGSAWPPRRRRAPVDHHALGRTGTARLREL